jgi:hypothetical protein
VSRRARRFALVVAAVAVVAGVAGFIVAGNKPFIGATGARVGTGELLGGGELFFIDRLGALATVGLAGVAFVGAWLGRRGLLTVAGAGFALATVLILFQAGRRTNWLGGRGNTMSFFLACALTFLVLGMTRTGGAGVPGARQ